MKLNFDWKNDGEYHQYCIDCHAESIERVYEGRKTYYFCSSCGQRHERSIVIDPAIKWWTENEDEYWHESAGIFIRNRDKKFLFFERLIFPFALTVPSGHVDTNEDPLVTVCRETMEEIGYKINTPLKIATEDIIGDVCRRGADAHKWHAYLSPIKKNISIKITEITEGRKPTWLTLDEARQRNLTIPVEYIINKYQDALIS